jgi:[acyl-carrier-protein] S-malonyltransferase
LEGEPALRIAFIFPGQGSQYVGMGRDLYETYPETRDLFDEADSILGFPLSKLCFEGSKEELNDTVNTQPALLTISVALLRMLDLDELDPVAVAGHSMGEYTALVAAGALDFADGLRLVQERGRVMKEAGKQNPGGMAAVLGLEADILDEACQTASRETGAIVQLANYNSPGQIVVSGHKEALEQALELAKQRGARRVIPLAVSIASHSPLMRSAAQALADIVVDIEFQQPRMPVIANVTAAPLTTVAEIREELVEQLTSTVQWVESVEYMIAQGVTTFVEIGPKDVLTGLMRRIDKSVRAISVENIEGVKAFLEEKWT